VFTRLCPPSSARFPWINHRSRSLSPPVEFSTFTSRLQRSHEMTVVHITLTGQPRFHGGPRWGRSRAWRSAPPAHAGDMAGSSGRARLQRPGEARAPHGTSSGRARLGRRMARPAAGRGSSGRASTSGEGIETSRCPALPANRASPGTSEGDEIPPRALAVAEVRPRGLTGRVGAGLCARTSPEMRSGSHHDDWAATPQAAPQSLGKTSSCRRLVAQRYQNPGQVHAMNSPARLVCQWTQMKAAERT
jgi:hypothetical protein